MKNKQPLVYLRRIDHRYTAVVTLASGKRFRRGTGCRDRAAAEQFADMLQQFVLEYSAAGNLFPKC